MTKNKKAKGLRSRQESAGWLFILPWFIGAVIFFAQPLFSFLIYSFTNFVFTDTGYTLEANANGLFAQYWNAFANDAYYPQKILETFRDLLYQVPVIVFFSLFAAILLSKKFRGRTLMRAIFFLPIIVMSGTLSEILHSHMDSIAMLPAAGASNLFDVTMLTSFLLNAGLPEGIVTFLAGLIADVADLVWMSGVQILIFLSALLAVPTSYYEVAQVEGATAWETFWKVTFPIVSPFVLATLIYTIVDSFTNSSNQAMQYIMERFTGDMDYSYAAALSWIYFVIVMMLLGLTFLLCRRFVFYGNGEEKVKDKANRGRRNRREFGR